MNKTNNGEYLSWQNSLLAKKIEHNGMHQRLYAIWNKANKAYPRATWFDWIDHSAAHILNVLRNLDLLIPEYVYNTISEMEAFVLIAATLLHDIGMIPGANSPIDLQYLANLRQRHGIEGERIIRHDFSDFLKPYASILDPICEIVKNHHGKFCPQYVAGLDYDLRSDALWVRLADELDFGPNRAPTWLLDYIRPNEESLAHWRQHNTISEPSVDLELFRIQVRGMVENEAFIRKLRAEFENPQSEDLQKIFLGRGLNGPAFNRTFIIWDLTEIAIKPGEDSKEIDTRPAIFSNDQFLLGARYLYNLGRYETAQKCFEDGVNKLSGRWTDMPATYYFYHYLKTLHALGHHLQAIQAAEQYKDTDFSHETRAAILASKGLGHWKLGELDSAMNELIPAVDLYRTLSERDVKHKVNEADARILCSIVNLEAARSSNGAEASPLIEKIETGLKNAERLFSEYEKKRSGVPESHYKGRYWGLMAFHHLLLIDSDLGGSRRADVWTKALEYSKSAHGGDELIDRNPFGAMCGKYCAAVVNFHKYEHCENKLDGQNALRESARIIRDVRQTYDDLFGTKRIFRIWPKVHRLFVLIRSALPKGDKLEKTLAGFYGIDEPVEKIEIYTPLH